MDCYLIVNIYMYYYVISNKTLKIKTDHFKIDRRTVSGIKTNCFAFMNYLHIMHAGKYKHLCHNNYLF